MSHRKIGALIVIEDKIRLQSLIDDSLVLDTPVSAPLLESIFYPGAPLHDGAVIIRGERIVAARVILPLTKSKEISPRMGTRHRAAIGISEECDAVTIVLSEETGSISITHRGSFYRDLTPEELSQLLEKLLVFKDKEEFAETAKMFDNESVSTVSSEENSPVENADDMKIGSSEEK
jgi:diadenylate cyclase